MKTLNGELWAITCFFNPIKYKNKLDNYLIFANNLKRQGVKLLTVELVFNENNFQLQKEHSDILIQVKTESVMWQKERLLNLGLENLPNSCDKVAWLDADVLIEDDAWSDKASDLLEKYKVIQLFTSSLKLKKNFDLKKLNDIKKHSTLDKGYAYSLLNGFFTKQGCGYAWAARRSLLEKVQFYDKNIIGSGDLIMCAGFFNFDPKIIFNINSYSTKHSQDLLLWIDTCRKECEFSIYYLEGIVFHLWHGYTLNREYFYRHLILKKNNFDPARDIRKNECGVWEWSDNKPALHKEVQRYFWERNENGNVIIQFWYFNHHYYDFLIRRLDRLVGQFGIILRFISPAVYKYIKKKKL